jgi:hypothetical protein
MNVMRPEKIPVTAAGVHEARGQFTAEFGLGLWDQAREPGDALYGIGLGGHL